MTDQEKKVVENEPLEIGEMTDASFEEFNNGKGDAEHVEQQPD